MKLAGLTRNRGIRGARITRNAPAGPTIGGAIAAAAAVRQTNRPVLLVVCLPLLLALAAAAGGRIYQTVAARQRAADRQQVGRFTRAEAARRAQELVARVTGVPVGAAEAVDVEVYSSSDAAKRARSVGGDEWDVLCRMASRGDYLVRLAANSGEPILVRKEEEKADEGNEENGDLRRGGRTGVLSRREASLWARRYLRLVGLPLPADAWLVRDRGYDFNYDCGGPDGTHGTRRMLRVRVSPKDGHLEHLQNVVYRKYPGTLTMT
jgi:hypothetical protein